MDINTIEGILRFDGFYVEEIKYYRKQVDAISGNEDDVEKICLSPQFDINIAKNPDDFHQANIVLTVEFQEEDNPSLPFYVMVKIRGFFSVNNSCDLDTCDKMFKINAVAVLFPYLRSLVTDVTLKSDHPAIILPTINTTKLFKEQSQ